MISALIRAQLNSSAPSGLTEVIVSSGALRGLKLKLDLKSEKYYWLGHYEPQLAQAIYTFCGNGMITYDVGADIGYISLVFAQAVGVSGHVYAFEPLPNNIQRIADHIALNSLQMVMQVVPYAISDYEGKEMFLVHQNHAMGKLAGSSGRNFNYHDKIEVNSLRLDDFVYVQGNPHPHVIKIDIEGGAIKAIPGMLRLLSECRPILFIELHGPEERQVAWNALKQNHYVIHRMEKNYPEIAAINDIAWKEYIVALPRESRPPSDNVS
jgi:FkbM family methyltransferase